MPTSDASHPGPRAATSRAVRRAADARRGRPGSPYHGGDPATSDRLYSPDELEFLEAIEEFKRVTGRRFPTWSEALRVCKSLGYRKTIPA